MESILQKDRGDLSTIQLSSKTLKKQVERLLAHSTQCRAILECVNDETGEYRIVLEGVLEKS